MRLSKELVGAINAYYAFKNIAGNGMFRSSDEKQRCCEAVSKAADKSGIGVAIAPGTMFFSRGKQKLEVNGPILPQ